MITLNDLKNAVENGNDFYFMYNGARAGVECTVEDSKETFNLWYGNLDKIYDKFDDIINDKLFDNKSISDLLDAEAIEIEFA